MRYPHTHRGGIQRIVFSALMVIAANCKDSLAGQPDTVHTIASLNSATFVKVLTNGKCSLIEFGGRRCIPCRQMQPILAELNLAFAASMNIFNVYVDEERDLARNYRISLIPTQIVFDRTGKEISRHVGYWEKEKLTAELRRLQIAK